MELVTIALFLVHPLIIAYIAQTKRGQIGLIWFIAALALDVLCAVFMDNAITSNPKFVLDPEYRARINSVGHQISFLLFTFVPPTIALLVAMFTLPDRKKSS